LIKNKRNKLQIFHNGDIELRIIFLILKSLTDGSDRLQFLKGPKENVEIIIY